MLLRLGVDSVSVFKLTSSFSLSRLIVSEFEAVIAQITGVCYSKSPLSVFIKNLHD